MRYENDVERGPQVLSVSELTGLVKDTLETAFPAVCVAGELSDVSRPQSGHLYFTLKDAQAQIRCVVWRTTAMRLPFRLEDGMEVICAGGLDVYPPRGGYQLVVREVEPRGEGALQLALRQLQQRLAAEGLFDPRYKKPLPRFPRRIAFVTSPTGAAIRDFLEVLRRRWRGVEVLVIPARVQGDGAAREIARGIAVANSLRPRPDVLVVGRGGGSMEDLWCFNEEVVVRAIFTSEIPVVSAVGHEIDVTLADLAADVRALTPTEAGELVVPAADELLASLSAWRQRLVSLLQHRAAQCRARLEALQRSRIMRAPFDRIRELARRVDELELRAGLSIQRRQAASRERLVHLAGRLEALSPLAVLGRGYSLTQRADNSSLIREAASLSPGELVRTRLASGSFTSRVEVVETND